MIYCVPERRFMRVGRLPCIALDRGGAPGSSHQWWSALQVGAARDRVHAAPRIYGLALFSKSSRAASARSWSQVVSRFTWIKRGGTFGASFAAAVRANCFLWRSDIVT